MNFPLNLPQPVYPLTETREDNVIRSSMDAGYEITRPRYTRTRITYELKWTNLRPDEMDMLRRFYDISTANGSLSFSWIHPIDDKTYTVRFTEPIKVSLTKVDLYEASCKIRTV